MTSSPAPPWNAASRAPVLPGANQIMSEFFRVELSRSFPSPPSSWMNSWLAVGAGVHKDVEVGVERARVVAPLPHVQGDRVVAASELQVHRLGEQEVRAWARPYHRSSWPPLRSTRVLVMSALEN